MAGNPRPSGNAEQRCDRCGRSLANRGLLAQHQRRCRGGEVDGQQAAPTPPQGPPAPAPGGGTLDEACRALQDGLTLEMACQSVGADPRPYQDAVRRVALRSPDATPDDKEVHRRVKQAEATFMRDVLRRLNDPNGEKDDVAAAKALFDAHKNRLNRQGLQLAYDCAVLLPIVRRHATPEAFRAVLEELAELDPEAAIQALDERLLP